MEEQITVKGYDIIVSYYYEPEEMGGFNKEPFPENYEIEEIAGLDPDFFTQEFKDAIEKELKRLTKEELEEMHGKAGIYLP